MQPARLRLLFERVPAVKTPFLLLEHRIDVDRDRVGGRIDYYYNQVGGSACVSAARGYVSWHTHTHPPRDVCLRTWCHTGDELSGERVVFETCRRPGDKIAPTQNKKKRGERRYECTRGLLSFPFLTCAVVYCWRMTMHFSPLCTSINIIITINTRMRSTTIFLYYFQYDYMYEYCSVHFRIYERGHTTTQQRTTT